MGCSPYYFSQAQLQIRNMDTRIRELLQGYADNAIQPFPWTQKVLQTRLTFIRSKTYLRLKALVTRQPNQAQFKSVRESLSEEIRQTFIIAESDQQQQKQQILKDRSVSYFYHTDISSKFYDSTLHIQYLVSANRFLRFSKALLRAFKDPRNLLSKMVQTFKQSLQKRQKSTVCSQISARGRTIKAVCLKESFISFCSLLCDCLIECFDLKSLSNDTLRITFNRQNIYSLVVFALFSQHDISQSMYEYLKNRLGQIKQALFLENIQRLASISISSLVPHKYCLNAQNYQYCIKRLALRETIQQVNNQPYESVIEYLKTIERKACPYSMLKVVIESSKLILKEIQIFYRRIGLQPPILEPDGLLPIMAYAIVKANIEKAPIYSSLINQLTSKRLVNTLSGYYGTTFQAAIELIMSKELMSY